MNADPNCPRCHGVGYFAPASRSLGRGLVCTCRVRHGKVWPQVSTKPIEIHQADKDAAKAENEECARLCSYEAARFKANAEREKPGSRGYEFWINGARIWQEAADAIRDRLRVLQRADGDDDGEKAIT